MDRVEKSGKYGIAEAKWNEWFLQRVYIFSSRYFLDIGEICKYFEIL